MTESVIDGGAPAPVTNSGATVSEATPAQNTAGTQTETKAESPPAVETPKEPKGFMKRIDELTRFRREAERDRDYWREFAMRQNPQSKPAQQPSGLPTQERPKADGTLPGPQELLEQVRKEVEQAERRKKFDERVTSFASSIEDYHAVVNESTPISEGMADAIMDSDEAGALMYYLGQNSEIATKLYHLSPAKAGREIQKIEDRLVAERKKAAEKPVSQAPAPPPKIDGSNPANVEKDPSKMGDAEFSKWFRKNVRKN